MQAAAAYREAGATEVHAVTSHLVLPGAALDNILACDNIESVNGTDSHPSSAAVKARGGIVTSIAKLMCTEIARS